MKCTSCGAEVSSGTSFCGQCGTRIDDIKGATSPPPPPPGSTARARDDESASNPAAALRSPTGRRDDPEEELWTGSYSPKAMLGHFVAVTLLSIACLALSVFMPVTWPFAIGAMVLVWLWVLALSTYRRLNIGYRLTSQRFFHSTGILTRTTDRIEVIEMDDVTYSQSIFERMFGVGTIKITSSDPTHPVLVMQGIDDVQQIAELIDKARRKEMTRRGLRIHAV
jgi:membrane protein YdbS with pleckstrin-like domain